MKVAVVGLWHLGSVTAACLAAAGFEVSGFDSDGAVVDGLAKGDPPLFEPGLNDLLKEGIAQGRLSFTKEVAVAVSDADVVWVTYDTPVDEADRADVDLVVDRVVKLFPYLSAPMVVLLSSQLPVGTTARLEAAYRQQYPDRRVGFACSPENLRLGRAVELFRNPDRIVVGVRSDHDRETILKLMTPFTDKIEWMSVESAEMTKHAINAFLATSVTFINELALLCEQLGADAKEVERGLKSDSRIGSRAYLAPGAAFAGGTLARDVRFLKQLGVDHFRETPLFSAIEESNAAHHRWTHRKVADVVGELRGSRIALWGLAYKPGTSVVRRSAALDLARWLSAQGAEVRAFDPAVANLDGSDASSIIVTATATEALDGANVLVVSTACPEFADIKAEVVLTRMKSATVIDAGRFLESSLGQAPGIRYIAVGTPAQ